MPDEATLAYYQRAAPRYTLSFGCAPSRHLDAFLDLLEPGAGVLEVGCGAGRDAARMVERGFSVDATDGTPAMVGKAKERFGVQARVMRFDQLDARNAYDAVWAHASLLHVARSELPGVLDAIRRALNPGGWHYASYKLGDGEGRCLLGRLHNFPDQDWILAAYREAGFAIENTEMWEGSGADGTVRDWIAITARKP
ncbi:class I SAM-dependent methyltransferase [Aurantiacibacter poecillastricola]|uniref:class I SAM-dependent methyltransferase n=1 Tax=Aurantiacibacter poecillastricola TaxID=3064385 RepID=UPI00273E062E|nr:class I SAM-dependent methyltransferase [Aurantiacibacter sp. 219JJ12-13]MDP5261682.1 class I SAM-dependent methyltransferase [Aurantiacibacter sp. 219JJ12-13]